MPSPDPRSRAPRGRRRRPVGPLVGLAAGAVLVATSPLPASAEPAPVEGGSAFSLFLSPGDGPNTDADRDRVGDDLAAALAADPSSASVRVLVGGVGSAAALAALPPEAAAEVGVARELRLLPGFVATVPRQQVGALAAVPGVERVELDGETVAMGLARGVRRDAAADRDFGLAAARRDAAATPPDGRLDGTGSGVCVVDTGLSAGHEQFAGRNVVFTDLVGGRAEPYDDNGHGTHVAGIALGDGVGRPGAPLRPEAGRAAGVAGGADVFVAKALAGDGTGRESDAVAGVEWCLGQDAVRVVLLPLGAAPGDGGDLLSRAVDAAAAAGVLVVVAAGNGGDGLGSVTSPAGAPGALAVGAVSDASAPPGSRQRDAGVHLAPFSGRGATAAKPDLVAPGVTVLAAAAGTRTGYTTMTGTSMAAAYVAGAAALGFERDPDAAASEVAAALRDTAADRGPVGADPDWGAGVLDVRRSIAALAGASAPVAVPSSDRSTGTVAAAAPVTVPIAVPVAGAPLAATLLVAEPGTDLDVELYDPAGNLRAESRCPSSADLGCGTGRQETVGVPEAERGEWQLVVSLVAGDEDEPPGAYVLDVVAGAPSAPAAAPPTTAAPRGTTP